MRHLVIWFLVATSAAADFERDIRPLLQEHCVECHGPRKQKGGLRLDAKPFAFKGGTDGSAIVAGRPSQSLLYQRISSRDDDERMPPHGPGLTPTQIAAVGSWIESGAIWPRPSIPDGGTGPCNR
jgi:mono/diheme cytochrome c family protein